MPQNNLTNALNQPQPRKSVVKNLWGYEVRKPEVWRENVGRDDVYIPHQTRMSILQNEIGKITAEYRYAKIQHEDTTLLYIVRPKEAEYCTTIAIFRIKFKK